MATVNYDMRKLDKRTTLKVTFSLTREWKVRKWIAGCLIKLAALVLGCGIEIN